MDLCDSADGKETVLPRLEQAGFHRQSLGELLPGLAAIRGHLDARLAEHTARLQQAAVAGYHQR